MRIHVLTPGFTTPNGRAFLFPLIAWRRQLIDAGFDIHLFSDVESCDEADAIVVDSKFHRTQWLEDPSSIMVDFSILRERCSKLIYCDTTDSSGGLQIELLPIVDEYWKSQLLCDRTLYMKSMYGYRIYTDYYHVGKGVCDLAPAWSSAVVDPEYLSKLKVSWNSGLADYSLVGPVRMSAYQRIPCASLLRFPENSFVSPASARPKALSCRFGVAYARDTVAWQRKAIKAKLAGKVSTDKLSRRNYFSELKSSKVVLSPFGLGEITLKDFEVFLTGGLLVKPDMSHIETWPALFRSNETMISYQWDLEDLDRVLNDVIDRWRDMKVIAETGQDNYRTHISTQTGPRLFIKHLSELFEG